MANEQNLIPNEKRTPSERRENAQKAGKASGKSRRAKKTVRKLLDDLCNSKCKNNAVMSELAEKLGLDDEITVKQLIVFKSLFNTLKRGNMDDLDKIMTILGENETNNSIDEIKNNINQLVDVINTPTETRKVEDFE